jgi:hypothetical protein
MKRIALITTLVGIATLSAAVPAFAQQPQPQQPGQSVPATQGPALFPGVSGLEPFSAEANFMSLAGYLRWLMFQQQGQWLSRVEAERIVNQQGPRQ